MTSSLELREFHTFLEGLIETSVRNDGFSIEKIVGALLSKYPEQMESVQRHVNDLGLRALIRNNCRSRKTVTNLGPDLFGHYQLGKLVPVPYLDGQGKQRWDKKPPAELSFDDLDRIRARRDERPTRQSKERQDYDDIAARTAPYRDLTRSVAEALAMAERDAT